MPDDVAEEKVKALQTLGAEVQRVRPTSIVDKKQVRTFVPLTHALNHSRAVRRMYALFFSLSIILTATSQNMARQAAVRFGQPSALDGIEGAGISHEMATGSPSVVVSTTSSHVRVEGTEDDLRDTELLTKPRGFFADQFEVSTSPNRQPD